MTTKAFAALPFLFVLGCSESLGSPPAPGARVEVHRFGTQENSFTPFSAIRRPERLIIRDASAWAAAWKDIAPNASQPAPSVDFSCQMVVLAALGQQPDAGYQIRVDSAAMGTHGLTIWIATITAGAGCASAAVITQPVDIASLPRIDADAHFVDVPTVLTCP